MTDAPPSTRSLHARGNRIRWFSLVWLGFLIFPALELYREPRPVLEYVYGTGLLLVFIGVFVWAFFLRRWVEGPHPSPYRPPSLVGALVSYAVMLLLLPLIGWNGAGFLIYAASFAGAQRSPLPAVVTSLIGVGTSFGLWLGGELELYLAGMMGFFSVVAAAGNHASYRESIAQVQLRRSQAEVVRVAKIAERERIARDLHDLLGHTLSVIVLKSELASKLAEKNPARAAQEIRDVERIARESLQEVRSAVRGYRSTGLEGELAGVRLACEAAGLKLELYLQPVELEWAEEQTLAFALREATTNAIRHARATHLWVSLEPQKDSVRLSIWDDGSGQIVEGNGLRGMRERLEGIGGRLIVDRDAKGLTALIPLAINEASAGDFALEAAPSA